MSAIAALVGYLLGSIPFGVLASRAAGRDLRREGSGNPGATNALRVLGPGWALAVLLGDTLKGVLAAYVGFRLAGPAGGALGGAAAAMGHAYPFFGRIKGGKAVATSVGVLLLWDWRVLLIALAAFLLAVALLRIVSLASLVGALAAAVAASILPLGWPLRAGVYFLVLLIALRHRANVARLARGKEPRLGQKA